MQSPRKVHYPTLIFGIVWMAASIHLLIAGILALAHHNPAAVTTDEGPVSGPNTIGMAILFIPLAGMTIYLGLKGYGPTK